VSSVVTYWQLPPEEATLFQYLARTGDAYAFSLMEAAPSPEQIQAYHGWSGPSTGESSFMPGEATH
jgi:hypothetical protein